MEWENNNQNTLNSTRNFMNNNEILEKIENYVNENYKHDRYYENIFLLLKLQFLKTRNNNHNRNHYHIPSNIKHIFDKNPSKLTFAQIAGFDINSDINNLSEKMIYIPKQIITSFFLENYTKCVGEKKYIKNKLDLYISLLTYIYHNINYTKLNKIFHARVASYIVGEITNRENVNIDFPEIYSSIIYNFTKIPNIMDKYIYIYHNINIDIINNKYSYNTIKNSTKIDDNFIKHHLTILHKFYNEYILLFLIYFTKYYTTHPLVENGINQKIVF